MDLLRVGGDALWILSLSLMAGASRQALARTTSDARPPMFGLRVGRIIGFCWVPAAAFAASLWLAYAARMEGLAGDMRVVLFGLRALSAALFALLHLSVLSRAMAALGREGKLRP